MMPDFHHFHEEQAWREAHGIVAGDATLESCPSCGDPGMTDSPTSMHKVCTTCGHKQPIHVVAQNPTTMDNPSPSCPKCGGASHPFGRFQHVPMFECENCGRQFNEQEVGNPDMQATNDALNAPGGFAEQLGQGLFGGPQGPGGSHGRGLGSTQKTALCPPLLALAAPLVEGLGAETAGAAMGSAMRAGAGALTDPGLKGFVARHAAMKGLEGVGGQAADAAESMNPAGAAAPPTDDTAMYARVAGDDNDDKGGGSGAGDDGHDDVPDAENQGFEEEHGDSPDLFKDTDMLGPGQEGLSEEQNEALAHLEGCGPLVAQFIIAPESGKDSKILSDLDSMLTTAFKGHGGFESKYQEHFGGAHEEEAPEHDEHAPDEPDAAPDEPDVHVEDEDSGDDDHHASVTATIDDTLGWVRESMLPGQVPPNSAIPAQTQGQPMTEAVDGNQAKCPQCGGVMGNHAPGCPAAMQTHGQPMTNAMPMVAAEHHEDHTPQNTSTMFDNSPDEAGSPVHDLTVNSNVWVDEGGRPLEPDHDYWLESPTYTTPNRITVTAVHGDKLHVQFHTKFISYDEVLTPKQVTSEALSFKAADDQPTNETDVDPSLEHNNDDNTVAESAGADQSDTFTPVSKALDPFELDAEVKNLHPERNWLWASVPPPDEGLDKTAGKDFTPREQRKFIDEPGTARNLDKLSLEGTHYVEEYDFADDFNW